VRHDADLAYAREDWLSAEKEYKNLTLIYPDDISINERLSDISAKLDATIKDREKQIEDWKARAEAAMKSGTLLPPEKDNAWTPCAASCASTGKTCMRSAPSASSGKCSRTAGTRS